jgi:hypothetical protein
LTAARGASDDAAVRVVPVARVLLILALAACTPRAEPASDKPFPATSAEIAALRDGGVAWTNAEIRGFYLRRVAAIGPAAAQWKAEGLAAEERAHRAFQMRHDARLLTRAMMTDAREVAALRARDQAKYGSPDGPSFDWLVAHEKEGGATGDAVYEGIVQSAQRTDRGVNEALGL